MGFTSAFKGSIIYTDARSRTRSIQSNEGRWLPAFVTSLCDKNSQLFNKHLTFHRHWGGSEDQLNRTVIDVMGDWIIAWLIIGLLHKHHVVYWQSVRTPARQMFINKNIYHASRKIPNSLLHAYLLVMLRSGLKRSHFLYTFINLYICTLLRCKQVRNHIDIRSTEYTVLYVRCL